MWLEMLGAVFIIYILPFWIAGIWNDREKQKEYAMYQEWDDEIVRELIAEDKL